MIWIFFTIMAAFMQAWRNAFQKQLSTTVDAYGVTLARFIGATPLAVLYLLLLYHFQPVNHSISISSFGTRFWLYIAMVAVSQILATILMVKLFQQKNYAIGVGLAKSEAILAAIIGVAVLGVQLSWLGWLGVLVGAVAVFLLSGARSMATLSWPTLWTGLASGLCFAIASLMVREASLELSQLPFLHRAGWVLLCAVTLQNLLLLVWLSIKSPKTLGAMRQRKGLTARVSLASFLGSLGWFSAMSLQSVPLVKTLGQIEVVFTLLISLYFFKEKLVKTDHAGLWLVMLGAVLVIWA